MERSCHKEQSYEISKCCTYYSNVIAKVEVLNMQVKHQGQGHKVKSVGNYGKVLFQATLMRNIKVLVQKI
jgi:hypothetical protein